MALGVVKPNLTLEDQRRLLDRRLIVQIPFARRLVIERYQLVAIPAKSPGPAPRQASDEATDHEQIMELFHRFST